MDNPVLGSHIFSSLVFWLPRPNCLPNETRSPYSVVSCFAFVYASLIGNDPSSTLFWIFESTFLITSVLPVPGLPYTSKLDGLDSIKIGNSDCVIFSCSGSLWRIWLGMNVKWSTSLFLIRVLPFWAASKRRSIGSIVVVLMLRSYSISKQQFNWSFWKTSQDWSFLLTLLRSIGSLPDTFISNDKWKWIV